ncbi:TPA: hypothetical protein CPT85_09645, partial [Candidatus Gastranaerophilales bacterium HUM_21]
GMLGLTLLTMSMLIASQSDFLISILKASLIKVFLLFYYSTIEQLFNYVKFINKLSALGLTIERLFNYTTNIQLNNYSIMR